MEKRRALKKTIATGNYENNNFQPDRSSLISDVTKAVASVQRLIKLNHRRLVRHSEATRSYGELEKKLGIANLETKIRRTVVRKQRSAIGR